MAGIKKFCPKCGLIWGDYDNVMKEKNDPDFVGFSERNWEYCYFCNVPLIEHVGDNYKKHECDQDPEAVRKMEEFYERRVSRREAKINAYYDSIGKYKCPNCGGRDTKKISTSSRIFGVATLGLASSSIGKTYKCKKCGYKW